MHNKNLFLTNLENRRTIVRLMTDLVSGEDRFPATEMASSPSASTHCKNTEKALLVPFHMVTNSTPVTPALMI